MSLWKAEMELIAAPCPFHLASRASTFSPAGVFHAGECQEAATVCRQQSPISASVRGNDCSGATATQNSCFGANRRCLFFFPSPKSSSEGLGTMISRSFSGDQKESCGGYILVAV